MNTRNPSIRRAACGARLVRVQRVLGVGLAIGLHRVGGMAARSPLMAL